MSKGINQKQTLQLMIRAKQNHRHGGVRDAVNKQKKSKVE
jgi:hypothetical protein